MSLCLLRRLHLGIAPFPRLAEVALDGFAVIGFESLSPEAIQIDSGLRRFLQRILFWGGLGFPFFKEPVALP